MINSVLASVFGQPAPSEAKPGQAEQGQFGHLGGAQGVGQGAIGAAVPQLGPGPTGLRMGPQGNNPPPASSSAAGGQGNQQSGGAGLEHLLPLLGFILPLLGQLLGPALSGGQISTPRRGGVI